MFQATRGVQLYVYEDGLETWNSGLLFQGTEAKKNRLWREECVPVRNKQSKQVRDY